MPPVDRPTWCRHVRAVPTAARARAAQTVHRFGQLGLFGHAGTKLRLGFSQFVGGDEVDRADAFAIGGQPVHRRCFLLRVGHARGIETKAFG